MTALSWARLGLLWSACWLVFSLVHAFTASALWLALLHAVCALVHLGLCVWSLRVARLSRRLLASIAGVRCADRAKLRAYAWLAVWSDRGAVHGARHPRTMAAHLGAVRAAGDFEAAVFAPSPVNP